MEHALQKFMKTNGLRLTVPRMAIFDSFNSSDEPLSVATLVAAHQAIDRASIYRTVHLFKKMGVIRAVAHGWTNTYELAEPYRPHHHHLVCEQCGAIIEIKSQRIESLTNELAKECGFTPTTHHFEVKGLCRECQLQEMRV